MEARARVVRFVGRDTSRRGIGKDGVDYWFEVKLLDSGNHLRVPVSVSRTARATQPQGLERALNEEDFEEIARGHLEYHLSQGFLPTPELQPQDYDKVLEINSLVLGQIARQHLR